MLFAWLDEGFLLVAIVEVPQFPHDQHRISTFPMWPVNKWDKIDTMCRGRVSGGVMGMIKCIAACIRHQASTMGSQRSNYPNLTLQASVWHRRSTLGKKILGHGVISPDMNSFEILNWFHNGTEWMTSSNLPEDIILILQKYWLNPFNCVHIW